MMLAGLTILECAGLNSCREGQTSRTWARPTSQSVNENAVNVHLQQLDSFAGMPSKCVCSWPSAG